MPNEVNHDENTLVKTAIKVIAFDSWTGGDRHYERLLESFREKGIELTLVHLGSWGVDPGRPAEEQIRNLRVRDISYYPRRRFPDILDAENPLAVIFLSTETFAHRAFNRYCRLRGIPTVHLFHGLRGVQVTNISSLYSVNVVGQFRFISDRLFKALTRVWPTYMKALWQSRAKPNEWIRFAQDIVTLALGRFPRVAADDSRADVCCVYIEGEIKIAAEKYGFDPENIFPVGNPDLIQFGLSSELIGSKLGSPWFDYTDVMYIDAAFTYSGWMFASTQDYLEHLIEMRKKLADQGKHLVFKPHPDHFRNNFIPVLTRHGFDVCLNEDFVSRLQKSCACIAEQSSVAVIPALMGMPLMLAGFGKFKGAPFGDMLMAYPRARVLADVAELSAVLEEEQAGHDAQATMGWIAENAGPLPAEKMPERVAQVLLDLIHKTNGSNENRD